MFNVIAPFVSIALTAVAMMGSLYFVALPALNNHYVAVQAKGFLASHSSVISAHTGTADVSQFSQNDLGRQLNVVCKLYTETEQFQVSFDSTEIADILEKTSKDQNKIDFLVNIFNSGGQKLQGWSVDYKFDEKVIKNLIWYLVSSLRDKEGASNCDKIASTFIVNVVENRQAGVQ